MRNYENSANDFNSYRSGRERSRLDDLSSSAHARESYGGREHDITGSSYSNRSSYGSHQGSSPYSSSQAGWSTESNYGNRNQNPTNQQSWMNQNPSNQSSWNTQNRSSWQPSSHQGSSYNTSGYGSAYGQHQDRDIFDRAGDAMERTGQRISNAWDRWTDDDDRRNRNTGWGPSGSSHVNRYGSGTSNYGSGASNYGSGASNYGTGSSYGSGYGSSNYGAGSYGGYNRVNQDPDRYSSTSRRTTSDFDRDRDTDRGFFERVGDRISNAWDRVTGDEEDRNYNPGANRWSDTDRNRTSRGSSSYGPPYSYGSSSDRDYQW